MQQRLGDTRRFTYEAAGNVTYDNRTGSGYGYTYDAAGRMATFSINGVLQAEYRYNFAGRQVIRKLNQQGVTIHSVFDSQGNRIAEYNEATGTLIREYVWLDGAPIVVVEAGVAYYIRTDHIGRPVFATNAAGVKVWTATYLPFGGVRTTTGAPIDLRFPGQWFQSESGLHQNWMRDYDPTTGRYVEADPLGLIDGASVYGYAGQNPVANADPTGQCFGPAAFLMRACIAAGFMMYDYLSSDCYTWGDFAYSLFSNANPFKPLRMVNRTYKFAKKWGGQGSNSSGGKPPRTANPPKVESKIWKDLKPYKGSTKTNGKTGKDREYYEWDYTHNDIEVYDSRGRHKGSMHPTSGEMYKGSQGHRIEP